MFVQTTLAVSAAKAVSNAWWRKIRPAYNIEDAKEMKKSMYAKPTTLVARMPVKNPPRRRWRDSRQLRLGFGTARVAMGR